MRNIFTFIFTFFFVSFSYSQEKVELKNLITQISKEGISILIIEHDVKLITSLCDIVYVMDRGKIISQGTPEVIKNDEVVVNAYLGKSG